MYNRVYGHLTSNSLLHDKQFGFQANNSTEHAVIQFTREICKSFEKGEYTLGVFIDLSTSFIYDRILLKKLEYYGLNGTPLA